MAYGDDVNKQEGITREPEIAQKVIEFLISKGYKVTLKKSSFVENTKQKIDYFLIFDETTPFLNQTIIPIDIKARNSYTRFDKNGENTLEQSKSKYIITNLKGSDEYTWVNVKKLKECIEIHEPDMFLSNDKKSKYFWLNTYVNEHRDFFGKSVTTYTFK